MVDQEDLPTLGADRLFASMDAAQLLLQSAAVEKIIRPASRSAVRQPLHIVCLQQFDLLEQLC